MPGGFRHEFGGEVTHIVEFLMVKSGSQFFEKFMPNLYLKVGHVQSELG